jgi:hypothetical protein
MYPFGIPPSTTETIIVIPNAISNVCGSVKSFPNIAKITAILIIEDILEPSLKGALTE